MKVTNEMRIAVLKELVEEWHDWEMANGSDTIAEQLRPLYHKIDGDKPIEDMADQLGDITGEYFMETSQRYHTIGYQEGFNNAKQLFLGAIRHGFVQYEKKQLGMTFEHFLNLLDENNRA
jgi:hypothetical protein